MTVGEQKEMDLQLSGERGGVLTTRPRANKSCNFNRGLPTRAAASVYIQNAFRRTTQLSPSTTFRIVRETGNKSWAFFPVI
jgi:hypothetical protein